MGKFLLGAAVGTAVGFVGVNALLATIWRAGEWQAFATDVDNRLAERFGRERQLGGNRLDIRPSIPGVSTAIAHELEQRWNLN